jgi:hypothetical protein
MALNGEINAKFGMYKNICCGIEIVIPAGIAFPECPVHVRLSTQWRAVTGSDEIPHVSELRVKRNDPAA